METNDEPSKVIMWMGRRIEDLGQDELLEVIQFLANENNSLKQQLERWMEAGDPIKYLMQA